MKKLLLEDLPIRGKKVLTRVDFNVPLDGDGEIVDATKIEATFPTIQYILKQGGSIVLMSHLGRPDNEFDPELSLAPVAKFLSKTLGVKVTLAPDCIGSKARALVEQLKPGEIVLLENLRFHRSEEHPEEDPQFAKELASYGDFYVNDAFGTAHRKHSSTWAVPKLFPGKATAGTLMAREVDFLSQALLQPKRPFHAIVGGAKISSKLGVLKSLVKKCDALLIGGGMAFTFLKAMGKEIGSSICEEELIPIAKEILAEAKEKGIVFLLPVDFVVANEMSDQAKTKIVTIDEGIEKGMQGLDIGPKTRLQFVETLKKAKTILWNGPVGVFEIDAFAAGTIEIAEKMAQTDAVTIVAGGDTIAAVHEAEVAEKMTHISTGGGATLEFIEYGTLPGIEALSDKLIQAKQ